MKRFLLFLVPLFALALIGAGWQPATAYKVSKTSSGNEIKWSNKKMTFKVNAAGGPTNAVKALKAAAATWTNVSSCSFKFTYGGTSTSTAAANKSDGVNLLNFGNSGKTSILAENYYFYYVATGYMAESNIKFNTYYKWSTNLASGTYDLQNVATHELGHALSLADLYGSTDKEKTMYGYCDKQETKKRSLASDDINGIRHLYP